MSLFRQVSRYSPSPLLDPRENRLTEVTAAVLREVNGLGLAVAGRLVEEGIAALGPQTDAGSNSQESPAKDGSIRHADEWLLRLRALGPAAVRVTTQRTTQSKHFVDLELRFRRPGAIATDDLLLWIEVKHGASLHGDQLDHYVADIASEPARDRLVAILAPRQDLPGLSGVPEGMPAAGWQALADVVRRWEKLPMISEVDRYLLAEYSQYLHEEGLMDDDALTAGHAFVLQAEEAATAAVTKLMALADQYVQQSWGPRGQTKGGSKPSYGHNYWAHYSRAPEGGDGPETWRSAQFEWTFSVDRGRDQMRNAWVFRAGATFLTAKENPANVPENAEWLDARRAEGFEHINDWYWRLFRFLYPEELLAASTLDEQAEQLAAFVVESFRLLTEAPPPD